MSKTIARPSLEEIRGWPATVNADRAALALGCSRAHFYSLLKSRDAPVRTLKLGTGRTVIVTASLIALLSEGAAA